MRLSIAVSLLAASLPMEAAAARPRERIGTELVLPIEAPIVRVEIAGVPLRLRVGLEQKDVVELNPEAAARLPLKWEEGAEAVVGRETLAGSQARGELKMDGYRAAVVVATHGRSCCEGTDGAIAPAQLPYQAVRLVGAGRAAAGGMRDVPLAGSSASGAGVPIRLPGGSLLVRFTLAGRETVATAAGGAILADAAGGRFEGSYERRAAAFGILRPVRRMRLSRAVTLAGFALDRLLVRIADFRGSRRLPQERVAPGDIVVSRRVRPQGEWPAVLIGGDLLAPCGEIVVRRAPATIGFRCGPTSSP